MTLSIDQIIEHLEKRIETNKGLCLMRMRMHEKEGAAYFRGQYMAYEDMRDLLKSKRGVIDEP